MASMAHSAQVSMRTVRAASSALHATGMVSMALLLWCIMAPAQSGTMTTSVSERGTLNQTVATLMRSAADSVRVTLDGAPDARSRSVLRALRGSGRHVEMLATRQLPAVALTAEREWRATGGTRIRVVSSDSALAAIGDAAGTMDSVRTTGSGLVYRSGPVQGSVALHGARFTAAVAPSIAAAPDTARVLVIGGATWESRFLVAALEESGWVLDVALSLSPRTTVTQGIAPQPSSRRHAIVVVLAGASSTAVAALPAFVRAGGGVVIVGEAARNTGLVAIRAGVPAALIAGEIGAEASDTPRRGLDLTPISALASDAVLLEMREGRAAVAARRVGAGRVLQVGYDNSWLWRMAGNDDAPIAHRRWWNAQIAALVPVRGPLTMQPGSALVDALDTLDAAPVAALARDLGLPTITASTMTAAPGSFRAALDIRWLVAVALVSWTVSLFLRRWSGLI